MAWLPECSPIYYTVKIHVNIRKRTKDITCLVYTYLSHGEAVGGRIGAEGGDTPQMLALQLAIEENVAVFYNYLKSMSK